jgi:hypothetical protein
MSVQLSFQYDGSEYVICIKPRDLGFEMREGEQLRARAHLEIVSEELRPTEGFADRHTITNRIPAELHIR